ncbi:MAG: NmrA family NAD(P)-binding protein [Acidimicrobiia bacterium]
MGERDRQRDRNLTLVIGGTGKTGRRVTQRLGTGGIPIRLGSRTGTPPFDWDDAATWAPALDGVRSAYVTYQPDLAFPGGAERVHGLAELAVVSGVERLVLLSGRNEPGAVLGEDAVQESGAEWTIVRSSFFAQDFSEAFFLEPVLRGELAFPAGETAEPFIDAEDIADIVAAALTDDRHLGQLYEATGPRLLTFAEAVADIAHATGREIRYVPISGEQFASALAEDGLPPDDVTAFTDLFTMVLDGRSAYVTDGVRRALGREPRDFRSFALDTGASGVWDVPITRSAR